MQIFARLPPEIRSPSAKMLNWSFGKFDVPLGFRWVENEKGAFPICLAIWKICKGATVASRLVWRIAVTLEPASTSMVGCSCSCCCLSSSHEAALLTQSASEERNEKIKSFKAPPLACANISLDFILYIPILFRCHSGAQKKNNNEKTKWLYCIRWRWARKVP